MSPAELHSQLVLSLLVERHQGMPRWECHGPKPAPTVDCHNAADPHDIDALVHAVTGQRYHPHLSIVKENAA